MNCLLAPTVHWILIKILITQRPFVVSYCFTNTHNIISLLLLLLILPSTMTTTMLKHNNNVRMTSVVHIIIIIIVIIIVICCYLVGTQNRRGHTYHCMRINTIIMGGYDVYLCIWWGGERGV